MNIKSLRTPTSNQFPHLFLLAFLLAWPFTTRAQDSFPTPTPVPDPLAGLPVQVLDQQQVTVGTHTITYNRITPPLFPAAAPTPSAPPSTPATRTASGTSPNPTNKNATQSKHGADAGGGDKPYRALFLSATVYDHRFTEVRWLGGTGAALRAYVNFDFCSFTTVTNLETADAIYDLIFVWSNDSAASLTQAGQPLPDFSSVSAGHASYQIVSGDPGSNPNAVAALSALCAYYDTNGAQMVAAYNQQQVSNAAYQQWLQTHPSVPPNTVINYWPAKSRVYLPATQ